MRVQLYIYFKLTLNHLQIKPEHELNIYSA